jgi:hypothetical protein
MKNTYNKSNPLNISSLVNKDNSIEVEIKGRIVMGNKAHHANAALFKSEPI